MTITKVSSVSQKQFLRPRLWFDRIMALIVLANYTLVIFDLSYVPLRDFLVQERITWSIKIGTFERQMTLLPIPTRVSNFITQYDIIKGIEPHRDTAQYLQRVEDLNEAVNQLISQQAFADSNLIQTKEAQQNIDEILADLRPRSLQKVEQNPCQIANKTGT